MTSRRPLVTSANVRVSSTSTSYSRLPSAPLRAARESEWATSTQGPGSNRSEYSRRPSRQFAGIHPGIMCPLACHCSSTSCLMVSTGSPKNAAVFRRYSACAAVIRAHDKAPSSAVVGLPLRRSFVRAYRSGTTGTDHHCEARAPADSEAHKIPWPPDMPNPARPPGPNPFSRKSASTNEPVIDHRGGRSCGLTELIVPDRVDR